MSGPEVVGSIDTTTWSSGLGAIEDLHGLASDFSSGSWISGGLNTVALVGDTVGFFMDPLGTIISWGASWLLDHLEPLKGWLNDLTGDAAEVRGIGATWGNIGNYLDQCATQIADKVVAATAKMSGMTVEQYRAAQKLLTDGLVALGGAASGFGSAVSVAAELVQIVHDLVRDALGEIIGTLGSAIIEAVASLGVLVPKVICDVSRRVATWGATMGKKIDDLISSFEALKKLLNKLDEILAGFKSALRQKFPRISRGVDFVQAGKKRFDEILENVGAAAGHKAGTKYLDAKEAAGNFYADAKDLGSRVYQSVSHDAGLLWNNIRYQDLRAQALEQVRIFQDQKSGLDQLSEALSGSNKEKILQACGLEDLSVEQAKALLHSHFEDLSPQHQRAVLALNPHLQGEGDWRVKAVLGRDFDMSSFYSAETGTVSLRGFSTAPGHHWDPTPGTPTDIYTNMGLRYADQSGTGYNPFPNAHERAYSLHVEIDGGANTSSSLTYGPPIHPDAGAISDVQAPNSHPRAPGSAPGVSGYRDPYTGTGVTGGVDKIHSEWEGVRQPGAQYPNTVPGTRGFITEHMPNGKWKVHSVFDPVSGRMIPFLF
ncbi:prevent-host-death protein [Schaalia vaccimaxillae]|uniref:prevent-host-death protein n=1 Tax=Schaalia vaccimaxillae TaxID=183916 RepID=UPI0003B41476|nr:prevent-host-death protein [Schaalia vaccimaxillae]